MSEDIIERLKKWADGSMKHAVNNWADQLATDLRDAIAEIEFLRPHAGDVTRGESFNDIKRRVPFSDPVPHDFDEPAKLKPEGSAIPNRPMG